MTSNGVIDFTDYGVITEWFLVPENGAAQVMTAERLIGPADYVKKQIAFEARCGAFGPGAGAPHLTDLKTEPLALLLGQVEARCRWNSPIKPARLSLAMLCETHPDPRIANRLALFRRRQVRRIWLKLEKGRLTP